MQVRGSVTTIGEVQWNEQNADFLVGEILAYSGYARIRTNEQNLFQIISGRDIRYIANLPSYSATKTTNDDLPSVNSADWGELIYKSTNGFDRVAGISRHLRLFISRYGRVTDDRYASLIIIRDNMANLHQLLPLIRKMDVSLSKEEIAEHERQNKLEVLREKTRQEITAKFDEILKKMKAGKDEEGKVNGTK